MESLRELYRVGPGPSSSHTLAIQRACLYFIKTHPTIEPLNITLFGSLALTGKGHGTDRIISETLKDYPLNIYFNADSKDNHANTMVICNDKNEELMTIYSVGGGKFEVKGFENQVADDIYPESEMTAILKLCQEKELGLDDYVLLREPDILPFLIDIYHQMMAMIENGLQGSGYLPGPLKLKRVAKELYHRATINNDPLEKRNIFLTSFAYSCLEENACGKMVCTAPTLGSCGVVPAVLCYYRDLGCSEEKLAKSLAVGGLFGNIIKTNATISGAEGGCQAEIGAACAMAAAMASYLESLDNTQIANSAEIGIEHHLGLTCDPVGGYVQIPCIERNGVAAIRAMDAMLYAKTMAKIKPNRINFDMVVQSMNYTGKKISVELKETSLGGLAKVLPINE